MKDLSIGGLYLRKAFKRCQKYDLFEGRRYKQILSRVCPGERNSFFDELGGLLDSDYDKEWAAPRERDEDNLGESSIDVR